MVHASGYEFHGLGFAVRLVLHGAGDDVAGDGYFLHVAGLQFLEEFGVGQVFGAVGGDDEVVEQQHAPDGDEHVPKGKSVVLFHFFQRVLVVG